MRCPYCVEGDGFKLLKPDGESFWCKHRGHIWCPSDSTFGCDCFHCQRWLRLRAVPGQGYGKQEILISDAPAVKHSVEGEKKPSKQIRPRISNAQNDNVLGHTFTCSLPTGNVLDQRCRLFCDRNNVQRRATLPVLY